MACSRCLRWQQHVRINATGPRITEKRTFSTYRARLAEVISTSTQQSAPLEQNIPPVSLQNDEPSSTAQASSSKPLRLHSRRTKRTPNANLRSPVHNIDLSHRLGTRYSAPVIGAMEWQTSIYHYNKQTTKNYPVVAQVTNKLLEAYAVLEEGSGDTSKAHKKAIADRRKEADKVYVSPVRAKDYGSKIVLDVFVHDAKDAAKRAILGRQKEMAAKKGAKTARTGAKPAGARSPPFRARSSSTTGFKPRGRPSGPPRTAAGGRSAPRR